MRFNFQKMNITTNDTDTISLFNESTWSQLIFPSTQPESLQKVTPRSHYSIQNKHKPLSSLQIIELCSLYFILVEQTTIFILTFRKKSPKQSLLNTNDQQQRSIILPSKSLLYNCLHCNWIRVYSFSNICLSLVYFIVLILKHYYPNLLNYSSTTFYALPLTLVQQLLINFTTFHLLIISISVLQYFIRYYRLFQNKYSLHIYNVKNLLITKHTNVALILSGSLALIFAYNYIFYTPNYIPSRILLPLITLNMILLPLIDLIILIFIIICWIINRYKYNELINHHLPFDDQQQQQQHLTNNLRSTIEKATCIKCYSKFLQQNRNLLQDTDPYTKLHSKFFSHNNSLSTRPSIASPDDKRKYSAISFDTVPVISDVHSRLRTSYPCPITRNYRFNKSTRSQQDFSPDPRIDFEQNPTNDLLLQTTVFKFQEQNRSCHLCYRLLLLFLLKYILLTFSQHFIQMYFHLKHFYYNILKHNTLNTQQQHLYSNSFLAEYNETIPIICRFLFLFARFGDSLLLTCLPNLIKKYFPCWCRFNSKLLRQQQPFHRPSHQTLMKNTDSSTNEPLSNEELANLNDLSNHQQDSQRRRIKHRRFRLRFQLVPIWSKKRKRLFKENY